MKKEIKSPLYWYRHSIVGQQYIRVQKLTPTKGQMWETFEFGL